MVLLRQRDALTIHLARPAIVSAGVALLLYAVTLGGSYVYDDTILLEDPRFTHLDQAGKFWTQDYMPGAVDRLYRPLTCLTFAAEFFLHGDRPWIYHAGNALLFAGVSAAVAELGRRLAGRRVALAAGLLFASHPVHVEAVAGLVGRAELLCTLFSLLAMLLFLRPMSVGRAAIIVLCLAAAILSKEQGLLVPAMLLALTPYRRQWLNSHSTSDKRQSDRGVMRGLLAAVCLTLAAYLVFREELLGFAWDRRFLDWPINPIVRTAGLNRLLMPLALLGRYALLAVWPMHLSLDYGANVIGSVVRWREPYVYAGAVTLLLWCGGAAWAAIARRWAALFCLLSLAISYALVSNGPILIGTIFGERLVFLPSVFGCILAAVGLVRLLPRRGWRVVVALLTLVGGIRTFTYARQWNDPPALYAANLARHPESMILHGLVVDQLIRAGRYAEARAVADDCLRRLPDCWQSYQMCVAADLKLHDLADAQRVLEHADPRANRGQIAELWRVVKGGEK